MEVAIVGLGPWGLSLLERIITNSRSQWGPVRVHVVEPGIPGSGVYATDQPDYLILNTPCGQVSLYPWQDAGPSPEYTLGLYEWLSESGYRWVGDSCRIRPEGRAVSPHDYVPLRIMGEYLQWFYRKLVVSAPSKVDVVLHRAEAVNVLARSTGRECVLLGNGEQFEVDHVILTSGHTDNVQPATKQGLLARPYPVSRYAETIPPDAKVAIAGMGLAAIDVVTALTVGRGGSYVERGDRLRYTRSGEEPTIRLFSRSGVPYAAKAVATVDESDEYEAVVCTKQAIRAIQGGPGSNRPRRQVDFRSAVLPLILAEMQIRYYSQSALIAEGPSACDEIRRQLGRAWSDGSYGTVVRKLSANYGEFDCSRHFFGPHGDYVSTKDYGSQIYSMVEADLVEALRGGSAPVKSAYEVLRHVRELMRAVVEFKGLTLESYIDFHDNIKTRVNRLVSGPPVLRAKQLLALIDAGLLTVPFGPSPVVNPGQAGGFELSSRRLEEPYCEHVDLLIHGHLENPTICHSN